ncbi:hypothetical protein [Collimonas sp.]|jgi:hypothetical protein|uniref:hypothetical protein n=1 Tax=Collimonas sp. TaxID=1963772 RepID=UPI002C695DC6|nr:hypothetical protein [Collimonas sp.]HWW99518.1 hypothetical protein [Collimonas sp.]
MSFSEHQENYEGCDISISLHLHPTELAEDGTPIAFFYTAGIVITRHENGGASDQRVTPPEQYPNGQACLEAAISKAHQLIDDGE